MGKIFIYDIETLSNCFTYTGIEEESGNIKQFVIWGDRNDLPKLLNHLDSEVRGLIGFNNINFDYPVLHYIMNERDNLKYLTANQIAKKIYEKAQHVISEEWSSVNQKYVMVPQLDLFRIWHFNNKARMTSLKKLEIALRMNNVQDMPYNHAENITNALQVQEILDYNLNDVIATKDFYEISKPKIKLRKELYKRYGLNALNFPDSKIGEELMLKLYCEKTGRREKDVRKLRTHRKLFRFSEAIPNFIKYNTFEANKLLDYIKSIEVTELKGSFKHSFSFRQQPNFKFDLGTGGIHGCIDSGVYEDDDEHIIIDVDVASLYPSLAVVLGLYPEHLGEEFTDVYKNGLLIPRLEAKRNGDKVMNLGFKLALNSVYGKSNSEYSWLYDPLYTLKTTLAGQLGLVMLSEMLFINIDGIKFLQINTDGLTAIIKKEQKEDFMAQCRNWEHKTGLVLEDQQYSKMIIRDVNNYIAVSTNGKVKYKGAFRTYRELLKAEEYHKSFSQLIVPEAISKYFLEGIPVEETIKSSTNIYDFCKTFNATHGWKCETVKKFETKDTIDELKLKLKKRGFRDGVKGDIKINILGYKELDLFNYLDGERVLYEVIKQEQKTNRYYISKNGDTFRKIKGGRIIEIEANNKVVIFNNFKNLHMDEYEINYDYYIKECYKIINKIENK